MMSALNRFTEHRMICYDGKNLQRACLIVKRMWQDHYGQDLIPVNVNRSQAGLPNSTSAGLPFENGVTKGAASLMLRKLAKSQWRNLARGGNLTVLPCKAGVRRQLRRVGQNKPRLIWAYPGYITILENQFVQAVKDAREPPDFMGWSINWLDGGRSLERIARHGVDRHKWRSVAQLDFSSFDSRVPKDLIFKAFSILRSLFSLTPVESRMLDQLRYYFVNTPLNMYGHVYEKRRGIPSGSGFTQIIGSIVNMIMCVYASLMTQGRYPLKPEFSCWLGDDSLLFFDEGLCKEEFNDIYLPYFEDFGMEVSKEKSHYLVNIPQTLWRSPKVIRFLGREIDYISLEYRLDFERFSAQVVWPETPDRCRADAGIRLIGLVWAYGMYFDVYTRLKVAYLKLRIDEKKELVPSDPKLYRMLYYLLGLKDIDLTKFPSFHEVSNRYFDGVYLSKSSRTKHSVLK
nr:MAG: putative RNA-dependent RNA polymerase [Partitiviridae sp.]